MSRNHCAKALFWMMASVFAFCGAAAAQIVTINIPSEDLEKALDDYIGQTGIELIYNVEDVRGRKSHAVHGSLTPDAGLVRLLQDSGLVAERNASGAVVVFGPSDRAGRKADGSNAAGASTAAISQQDGVGLESVTVTGSRVISDARQAPTPVVTIPVDELLQTTPSNIPDALNKLPTFVSSRNQRTTGGSTLNWPSNFLNLRDFGTNRVLVLLDGMRMPTTDLENDVDTNTLPQALIERVDIVTGGASAVYGSDAITGVVNFVLDHHFSGLKIYGQAGLSAYGDDASYKASLVGGTDLFEGRGHIEFSYERYHSDGLQNQFARPLGKLVPMELGNGTASDPYHLVTNVRNTQLAPGGYIDSGPLADMTFSANGVLAPFLHGAPRFGPLEVGGGGGYSGESYFLFPGVSANPALVASLQTDQAFGRADYDIASGLHAWTMVSLSEAVTENVSSVQNFTATFANDNAFLPADAKALLAAGGADSFTMSKALMNDPGAISRGYTQTFNLMAGLDGTIGGFDWTMHFTRGQTSVHESSPETLNMQRLYAALDAVTDPATGQIVCRVSLTPAGAAAYPGCIPFDAFGPGADSSAAFRYVTDDIDHKNINIMNDFGVSVSGALFDDWAGPVKGALDIEYRNVSLETDSAYPPGQLVDCAYQNPTTCTSNAAVWNGTVPALPQVSENVREAALEFDVPILKKAPLAKRFDLNLAARYTEYSASGPATTWKLGGVWNVTDELMLRAAISRDIRAPTLNDLIGPTVQNLSGWTDYLTNQSGTVTVLQPSNPDLKPEVAMTTTMGFVYQPGWFPGFTVSADWYQIGIDNVINYIVGGTPSVDAQCLAGNTLYCGLAIRPISATDTSADNFPTAILVKYINNGRMTTRGIDGEIGYRIALDRLWNGAPGMIDSRLLAAYQPSLLIKAAMPGAPTLNQAGAEGTNGLDSVAAERLALNVLYSNDAFSLTLQERFHSAEKPNSDPTQIYTDPAVPAVFYTDLTLSYAFDAFSGKKNLKCFLTVENLFDRQPSMFIGIGRTGAPGYAYPAPFDEDVVGRYFTIGIRFLN